MIKDEKIIIIFIIVLAVTLGIITYEYKQNDSEKSGSYYANNTLEQETDVIVRDESQTKDNEQFLVPEFDSNNMHNIFGDEVTEPSKDYDYMDDIIEYFKPEKFIPKVYGEDTGDTDVDIVIRDENQTESGSGNDSVVSARSKSIIIDTDFASDADDILAIRIALCFQDKGMLDVKGISLSTSYSRSPLAIHALCKYDGYGSIPVAMDTSGKGVQVHTEYVNVMYEWPKHRDDYEQPVEMYRRLLAESPEKVNIITLGFLQNIENLMKSGPDKYSPLTGAELIQQKVDTLYVVGGSDSGRPSFNFYWTGEKVVKAAKTVTKGFPARVVYLPTDLSFDTFCGQFYNNEDKKGRDIVTNALKSNSQSGGVVAWDVFSMWCAVQDMNDTMDKYQLSIESGNWYVSDTGGTEWVQDGVPERYRITKTLYGGEYNVYLNGMLYEKFISKQQ